MKPNINIHAIVWDYDGTLADTRHKNLNVTKKIVEKVTGSDSDQFPALQSIANYSLAINGTANWQELYRLEFKFADDLIDIAGRLWTDYQIKDKTLVPFYDGIHDVIKALENFSQGIVSQNSHHIITHQLQENELGDYFKSVIGYEEVDFAKQKPQPDGLLMCVEQLTKLISGYVVYIGDHETDSQCAFNANQVFKEKHIDMEIISVGAFYGDNIDDSNWKRKPDFKARNAKDILEIINNLK